MDMDKLLEALDDERNDELLQFTTKKIQEMNWKILRELQLPVKDTKDLFHKLQNYRYVDEISDLKSGSYLRWIPIDNPKNIYLTKGAYYCDIKITDEGVNCMCKGHGYTPKNFMISMEKNLIFQKLSGQELVLLSALDHLSM